MEKLEDVIFYVIEKSIRSYRQYAQKRLKEAGFLITIDQWLVMKTIIENPGIKQNEISEKVFKDNASVARMIDLLVKGKYLIRKNHPDDRRRTTLNLTEKGVKTIKEVRKIVLQNRTLALKKIPVADIKNLKKSLDQIIDNCTV